MTDLKKTLARRTWLGGAAAAGAAAAAVVLLPSAPKPAARVAAAAAEPLVEPGGYQLTDHVKRYYATARV
jgi:hypothetical protein